METLVHDRLSIRPHTSAKDVLAESPFTRSTRKFGMWLFILSDALTFVALLAGYGFMRALSPEWPEQSTVFDIRLITFMTFVLISSSASMAMAVFAARTNERRHTLGLIGATIIGGLTFLGCQAYEWAHFIAEGGRPFSNPWGVPQFSAAFFLITGFHGFHVFSGVVLLAVVWIRSLLGRCSAEGVELAGLYWHFVDVVWVFVFAFFYLL